MLRVFEEQCEVTDAISVDDNDDDDSSQVNIKKSPGSDVMQNPSDSDAKKPMTLIKVKAIKSSSAKPV